MAKWSHSSGSFTPGTKMAAFSVLKRHVDSAKGTFSLEDAF
ncbi:hypothetical protein [Corynebacterium hiratae]|nr:hypothetical protein [Corynebacterium aurimucosum]